MSVHQTKRTELILPDKAVAALEEFAAEVGVHKDFDLLLIGEGAGGSHLGPAGWGCIAYDRELGRAILHRGATTTGAGYYALLVPYVHALWHHHASQGDQRARSYRVAIFSGGLGDDRCQEDKCSLWAAIDWYERRGYVLEWHDVDFFSNDWSERVYEVAHMAEHHAQDLKNSLRRGLTYWV